MFHLFHDISSSKFEMQFKSSRMAGPSVRYCTLQYAKIYITVQQIF